MMTSSVDAGRRKQRRVFFRLSHHALGVQSTSSHPLFKKPRRRPTTQQQQPSKEEEEEEEKQKSTVQAQTCELAISKETIPRTSGACNSKGKPKTFLEKLQIRLSGGQFRMLNEKLYTCSGEEAFKIFKDDPASFKCYHTGYQEQMSQWPSHPLDAIIKWLRKRTPSLVVADFGCGDGRLSRCVKNKVFSLDLIASDASIIACNMAHTPLKTQSIDVSVFCLSLMGTDYASFLAEAHRVLKQRGSLLIAEVRSRFDPNNGGADPNHFVKALSTLGFSLVSKDFSNKFFVIFEFSKLDKKGTGQCKWPILKPCIYKRR